MPMEKITYLNKKALIFTGITRPVRISIKTGGNIPNYKLSLPSQYLTLINSISLTRFLLVSYLKTLVSFTSYCLPSNLNSGCHLKNRC